MHFLYMVRRVYISARLSPEHWVRVMDLARSEGISGQVALDRVVERGLSGPVAHELRMMSAERVASGIERELREVLR